MEEKICNICGSDYSDGFYKNNDTEQIICEECLLEIPEVTQNTITHYYLGGDYIGSDEEDIEEVIDGICTYANYEKV